MNPEELTVWRVTVDLPGGRLLRVEPWEEGVPFAFVCTETPDAEPTGLRLPASALRSLREALDSLEEGT